MSALKRASSIGFAVAFIPLLILPAGNVSAQSAPTKLINYSTWAKHPAVPLPHLKGYKFRHFAQAECSSLLPCPKGQHCCGPADGCFGSEACCETDGTECNCNP